jgi:hypothetical protein
VNGTTIAGYLYGEETYCSQCIHDLFVPFDLLAGPHRPTEEVLDYVASRRRIARHDEGGYSSHRFPKPIYVSDVSGGDTCVLCGRRLNDSETPQ